MLTSQEVVSLYETVAVITDQMLVAARSADWQQLASLEQVCARHIATIKNGDREVAQGAVRARKVEVIQKILADDREIRNIVQPWMARLSQQMNNASTQRKLTQAYGQTYGVRPG